MSSGPFPYNGPIMSKSKNGNVTLNVVLIVALILGAAFMWERAANKQQEELDAQTEYTYVSPTGEFEFTIPIDWEVEEGTDEDGLILIDVKGPRNKNVEKAFQEDNNGEVIPIEEAFVDGRFNKLLESSVGKEYVIIQMEIVPFGIYALPEDKSAWRDDLLKSVSAVSGYSFGEFNNFAVSGADGWKYTTTLFNDDNNFVTQSYYLLGNLAEAEIQVYPVDSSYLSEAEEIISSMIFTTEEEAFDEDESV